MSATVFFAVLAAAAMHATWNALIKVRLDPFISIQLMSIGMGVASLPLIPWVGGPQWPSAGWALLSALVLHTGYKFFLTKAYETGDLAQAYPLARGTAPLIVMLAGMAILGEQPTPLVLGGILLLSAGTFLMSLRGSVGAFAGRAVLFALITSVFIAGYTLTDGIGGRGAPSPLNYAVWLYIFDAVWSLVFCVLMRGPRSLKLMLPEWKIGLVAGVLSAAAYAIAIWAATKAPVAMVAALRETSILFAMILSVWLIGERLTAWRIAAALCIVGGVVALRLG
jgi:drug/metabolite transporter (DMT)-like permease